MQFQPGEGVPYQTAQQHASHGERAAQKSLPPEMPSCTTMPAMAIIANRPLFSSFVCSSMSSAGSVGLRPSGSKLKSPGLGWLSAEIDQVSILGLRKVKTEKISKTASEATTSGKNVCSDVCWKAEKDGASSVAKSGWNCNEIGGRGAA